MKKDYLFYTSALKPTNISFSNQHGMSNKERMIFYSGSTDSFYELDMIELGLDVVCTVCSLLLLALSSLSLLAPDFWRANIRPHSVALFWGGAAYFVFHCIYHYFYCKRQLKRAATLKSLEKVPREHVLTAAFFVAEPHKMELFFVGAVISVGAAVWGKVADAPAVSLLGWTMAAFCLGSCFSGGGFSKIKAIKQWKTQHDETLSAKQADYEKNNKDDSSIFDS